MVVLSGIGDFYSSGNDFSCATNNKEELRDVLIKLIQAFVLFPKLLVAIVQGGAIGIAATTLPLCFFFYTIYKIGYSSRRRFFINISTNYGTQKGETDVNVKLQNESSRGSGMWTDQSCI
ncbi:unnamed protein product [Leptidea sinapis]|uniref:Uncharacterized protein n=1 Tax=Leptidea sinapis TaxID=189913 RepID=A0A5E4QY59_9NEOP|nr:unnamed protein product [Leptidea sinapis]